MSRASAPATPASSSASARSPPYATAEQGGPIDVQPKERKRSSVTAPPGQEVSASEFQEMVRDLGVDEGSAQPAATGAAASGRPVGGRRARTRATGDTTPSAPAESGDNGGNGDGDTDSKERKPRNKRHGRPR